MTPEEWQALGGDRRIRIEPFTETRFERWIRRGLGLAMLLTAAIGVALVCLVLAGAIWLIRHS